MLLLKNKRGFTLVELIIASAITLVIIATLTNFLSFTYSNTYKKIDEIVHVRNTRFALNYIEKRLRDMDQMTLVYYSDIKAIKGYTNSGFIRWIDLSGTRRNNAFIYFNRSTKQLRVNINNENNILVSFIEHVEIREIEPSNLIEIEVFASEIEYSVKGRFYINTVYR